MSNNSTPRSAVDDIDITQMKEIKRKIIKKYNLNQSPQPDKELERIITGYLILQASFDSYMIYCNVYESGQNILVNKLSSSFATEDQIDRLKKQILRNAIVLVQMYKYIENGQRYSPNDVNHQSNFNVINFQESPLLYSGCGYDDFVNIDRRTTPNINKLQRLFYKGKKANDPSIRDTIIENFFNLLNSIPTDITNKINDLKKSIPCLTFESDLSAITLKYQGGRNITVPTCILTPMMNLSQKRHSIQFWSKTQWLYFLETDTEMKIIPLNNTVLKPSDCIPTSIEKKIRKVVEQMGIEKKTEPKNDKKRRKSMVKPTKPELDEDDDVLFSNNQSVVKKKVNNLFDSDDEDGGGGIFNAKIAGGGDEDCNEDVKSVCDSRVDNSGSSTDNVAGGGAAAGENVGDNSGSIAGNGGGVGGDGINSCGADGSAGDGAGGGDDRGVGNGGDDGGDDKIESKIVLVVETYVTQLLHSNMKENEKKLISGYMQEKKYNFDYTKLKKEKKFLESQIPPDKAAIDQKISELEKINEVLIKRDVDVVKRVSLLCLLPTKWINDEIINFYLRYCLSKLAKDKNSHVCSTFFYTALMDEHDTNTYKYSNVQHWKCVKNGFLLKMTKVYIPINQGNKHWVLVVIDNTSKTITYYDSLSVSETLNKSIIEIEISDLLKKRLANVMRMLRDIDDKVPDYQLKHENSSRQIGGVDCGLYVCMYTEFLLSGLNVMDVEQAFIDKCRERMPLAILGVCPIKATIEEEFTLPSEYRGVYSDSVSSNQQEVNRLVQNQVQKNELCSRHTDVLSNEDLASINQIGSNHGVNDKNNEMKLKYYELKDDPNDSRNNEMVYYCKKILIKVNPSYIYDEGRLMRSEYYADKVSFLDIGEDVTKCEHDSVLSHNTMFLAVVVLPNEDTNSKGIESDILTRGRNAKSIKNQLQVGSTYVLKCKTSGCCKTNTINCPVHCFSHNLRRYERTTNSRVLLISYNKNSWDALLPPGEADPVNTSIVLRFNEIVYQSVECDGDGMCLFYSISNFVEFNKEIKGGNSKFNDKESFQKSGITDRIWNEICNLSREELNDFVERYPDFPDIERNAKQWTTKFPAKDKDNEPPSNCTDWAQRVMTDITNAWGTKNQQWPFEVHALLLSMIFKIKIQIIQDDPNAGFKLAFDTHDDRFCLPSQVQSKKQEYSATCVLLHCHGTLPNNTCHWNHDNILNHYEYLLPIQEPSNEQKMSAYTGRGGTVNEKLNPYLIHLNVEEDRSTKKKIVQTASETKTDHITNTKSSSTKTSLKEDESKKRLFDSDTSSDISSDEENSSNSDNKTTKPKIMMVTSIGKRKPGRPKKNVSNLIQNTQGQPQKTDGISDKKKRGRPKKIEAINEQGQPKKIDGSVATINEGAKQDGSNAIVDSSSNQNSNTVENNTNVSVQDSAAAIDQGAKQEGVDSSGNQKSSSETEDEIGNTVENNNNSSNETVGNLKKHFRHSKNTIVIQDLPEMSSNVQNLTEIMRKLPTALKSIMMKSQKKMKKNTKNDNVEGLEIIVNDLTLYRSQQKENIVREKSYLSFGQIETNPNEHNISQKFIDMFIQKDKLETSRTTSSARNFLLLPLHLLFTQYDIANSSTFIYVSAFSQMYTYLLYCPDINNCPWVLRDMLKKNIKGDGNHYPDVDNVQCLVLLHSPTIIDMQNLVEAISKEDVNNTDEDYNNNTRFNECDEYWSSIVVVTGCLYTIQDNCKLIWLDTLATDASYTQFKDLQQFLINIAFNGLSGNICLNEVYVSNVELYSTLNPFFSTWDTVNNINESVVVGNQHQDKNDNPLNDGVVNGYKANIKPGNLWNNSSVRTIELSMNQHYTTNVKEKKRGINDKKNVFAFPSFMKNFINSNRAIIVVKDKVVKDNIDTYDEDDSENDTLCSTAENISIDIATMIELIHAHGQNEKKYFADSSYSVEDITNSEACIKFCCPKNADGIYETFNCDSYVASCKCCGSDLSTKSQNMADTLKGLPDAMFCHLFKDELSNVHEYLYDENFDHKNIKQCEHFDHVKILDALRCPVSDKNIMDMELVHHSIFIQKNESNVHPLAKMMCTILHKELKSEQVKGEIDLDYIDKSTDIHSILPPSKDIIRLQHCTDKIQSGTHHDVELMKQIKFITKVDWGNNVNNEVMLPEGEKWKSLVDLIGEGKAFPTFHHTGLLPYLMNQMNTSQCELTNTYKTYPPASWPHAYMFANNANGHTVFIAETHISHKHHDTLKWIREQKDIIELNEEEHFYVFQFALNDEMVALYSDQLVGLQHNEKTAVSKKLKSLIRQYINIYSKSHDHEFTVTSTFPFRASESFKSTKRSNKKTLELKDVLWLIDSIHGSDSSKKCLLTQLISSHCYVGIDHMFTRDSTCIDGCVIPPESEIIIQPSILIADSTTCVIPQESEIILQPSIVGDNVESRTLRKRKQNNGLNNSNTLKPNLKPGSFSTNASPGCRMESKNEVYPRSNNRSHNLILKLTSTSWGCLNGNTRNTMYALGHDGMCQLDTTPSAVSSKTNYFTQLVHILSNNYHYSIALSKLMTNDNSLKFNELEECINCANVPSLILLNITYPGEQSRRHMIGIVPSVMIENKTEMHIVDGYNKDLKSFPLNEDNLNWCCSGCISYFIEQFVFFTPGKKFLSNLRVSTSSGPTVKPYDTIKKLDELRSFIPIQCRNLKNKRKR